MGSSGHDCDKKLKLVLLRAGLEQVLPSALAGGLLGRPICRGRIVAGPDRKVVCAATVPAGGVSDALGHLTLG